MCTRLCFTSCGVVNSITHAGMPIVSCAVSSSGSPSNSFFVDWLYIVQTPKHTNHSSFILISSLFLFFPSLHFFLSFFLSLLDSFSFFYAEQRLPHPQCTTYYTPVHESHHYSDTSVHILISRYISLDLLISL